MIAVALVIGLPGSASPAGTDGADNQGAVSVLRKPLAAPDNCPSVRRAVRFYSRRLAEWREKMGVPAAHKPAPDGGCPRYLAHVLQRKAATYRRIVERWTEVRTLHDFVVREGSRAWHRAVREAQRPYPSTESWLLSCSASEGGHGRWVPNGDGSGAGGWLQFMSGTFWRMWSSARSDVVERGFRVPRSASDWHSPLGQALAGAWGVTHGRSGEWYGSGC